MNTLLSAYRMMINHLNPLESVQIDIQSAQGCVLADTVHANREYPPFSQSAMDGYVVHRDDLNPTSKPLYVGGMIQAGASKLVPVQSGRPQRIFTGAPIPPGGEAVRIQENVEQVDSTHVQWRRSVDSGANIRHRGHDIHAGDALWFAGHVLSAADVVPLANLQIKTVPVHRVPRVGIVTTGDELIPFQGVPPTLGEVVDGNFIFLQHMLSRDAKLLHTMDRISDQLSSVSSVLESLHDLDLLITCGGMSVGDFDVLGKVLRERSNPLFYKVAVKPGKPIMVSSAGQTTIVGLPGNPVSTFVGYHLFVRPALRILKGHPLPLPSSRQFRLKTAIGPGGKRLEFLRAHVDRFGDVSVAAKQGSGSISGLIDCNALVVRPPSSDELSAGQEVPVYCFDDEQSLSSLPEFEDQIWPLWSGESLR